MTELRALPMPELPDGTPEIRGVFLESAKHRRDMDAIAIVWVCKDGVHGWSWTAAQRKPLIAALELVKLRLAVPLFLDEEDL